MLYRSGLCFGNKETDDIGKYPFVQVNCSEFSNCLTDINHNIYKNNMALNFKSTDPSSPPSSFISLFLCGCCPCLYMYQCILDN